MPISGVVVRCNNGSARQVAQTISGINGVEVHGILPDDQVIAVVEADSFNAEMATVDELQSTDGVVTVQLAYHNFEDVQ